MPELRQQRQKVHHLLTRMVNELFSQRYHKSDLKPLLLRQGQQLRQLRLQQHLPLMYRQLRRREQSMCVLVAQLRIDER